MPCLRLSWLEGVKEPNLVSWWEFRETEGTIAYDSSDNGHHGTLTGGVSLAPSETAVSFTGDSGHVLIPTAGMRTAAGTVVLWVKLTAVSSLYNRYFFGHTSNPTGYADRIQLKTADSFGRPGAWTRRQRLFKKRHCQNCR